VAAERGVTLLLTAPADDLQVACDRRRLETALHNLLDNALKHTPAGGTVEVGARVGSGDGSVRFWVRDSGAGISPEDLPHVFERFYRGCSALGDAGGAAGTGLGLAIVQSVAQAHGGRATVESRPGEGSTFTVELPG
jgi:signal transduction histidine kinase